MDAVATPTIERTKRRHRRQLSVVSVLSVVFILSAWSIWRKVQFSRLRSPLIRAVQAGNARRVRDLLDAGADPDVRLDYKPEPFTWRSVWRLLRGDRSARETNEPTVLIYAATKPDSFRIARAIGIKAPPEKIFAFLNDTYESNIAVYTPDGEAKRSDILRRVTFVNLRAKQFQTVGVARFFQIRAGNVKTEIA